MEWIGGRQSVLSDFIYDRDLCMVPDRVTDADATSIMLRNDLESWQKAEEKRNSEPAKAGTRRRSQERVYGAFREPECDSGQTKDDQHQVDRCNG